MVVVTASSVISESIRLPSAPSKPKQHHFCRRRPRSPLPPYAILNLTALTREKKGDISHAIDSAILSPAETIASLLFIPAQGCRNPASVALNGDGEFIREVSEGGDQD